MIENQCNKYIISGRMNSIPAKAKELSWLDCCGKARLKRFDDFKRVALRGKNEIAAGLCPSQ